MEELTLREIQLGELEILKQFKRICEEQNLQYYLFYGTLLGAVRHGGFIPWDDDVDVAMPRDDYEKFIAYCKENAEKLKPLELLHYSTNPRYIYPIARLNDTRYTTEYKDVDDYGLGLFIDIYPFDGCGNSKEEALEIRRKNDVLEHLISSAGTNHFEKSKKGGAVNSAKKLVGYCLAHIIGANRLCKWIDKRAKQYPFESKNVGCVTWKATDAVCYPCVSFAKKQDISFEDSVFSIPEDYDTILKIRYGNYMDLPPKSERIAHHEYSAYRRSI